MSPPGTADDCMGSSTGALQCRNVRWWDAGSTNTPVQLRHASRLEREGAYAWGVDARVHRHGDGIPIPLPAPAPAAQYLRGVGTVYGAGTVAGLSGGDTADTGLGPYSTGAHLCVQTLQSWRMVFPAGRDGCM